MRTVRIHSRGVLHVFGPDEAGAPALPSWLPAGPYRPARVEMEAGSGPLAWDVVAVWPHGVQVPDPATPAPWTDEQRGTIVVASAPEHFRCRVCAGRVNALYLDPVLSRENLRRHRWATCCPLCAAPVDRARLHALALFAPSE